MTKESTIYITEVDLARLRKLIEAARDRWRRLEHALHE